MLAIIIVFQAISIVKIVEFEAIDKVKYSSRPHSLVVRTSGSHPENMDSNSIGVTSASSVQAHFKINMWFVYMLLCDQKTFYIGITDQLPQRFLQHKNKLNISTKKFSDLKLVYAERYENKYEAAKREKQFKGWSHAKKQMLIDGKLGINTCTEFAEDLLSNLNN